jgi:hypothetical protein
VITLGGGARGPHARTHDARFKFNYFFFFYCFNLINYFNLFYFF